MKGIRLLLFLIFISLPAAAEVFQVNDIRIEGLQRVSAGTVFASLPINVGDLIDDETIREATRALFRTGYFDDIRIGREKGVLVIVLIERPAVSEINFEGNKAIKTEDLMKALREQGLAEGQIFRQSILEGLSQELERQYVAQGRYGAEVQTVVSPLPRNRVAINVTVEEGDVAAIKHINIVGNRDFEEEELLEMFELRETGWLSWITSDDKYAREKLSGDLERLESWYLDRGYLTFNIDSTQVSISPDRQAVYITINITEGGVYKIDEIELAGDLVVAPEELLRLLALKEGDTFSQARMTSSTEAMTRRLGDDGYAFAEVRGIPEIKGNDRTAKLTFFVDPGKRAYVRRIEYRGNTKTSDEVLRREMRQMESAAASSALIERSKVRLERLGFFKEVNIETVPVAGTNDQIDVFYNVEEQPSGSIGASLGFAQGTGLIVGANLQENNFLGTGNRIGVGVNRSTYQTSLSLSYTDPYYTEDGVSAGFNTFLRKTDYGEINISNYKSDSFGTSMNLGYPLSETQRLGFGIGYENMSIDTGFYAAQEIKDFVVDNGDQYNIFTFNLNWIQSTLNRGVLATLGASQYLGLEVAVPGGDMEYYRLTYSTEYYRPLISSLTLKLRGELGYADVFGDTSKLPFFKNFYSGGFGSVRGYKRNSLGPQDTPACLDPELNPVDNPECQRVDDPDPFGGNVLVEGGIEIIFPLPFIKDQRTMQSAIFFDFGNVFDTDCGRYQINCMEPDLGELRYSVGIGGTWLSGFGPITVSLGKALNAGDFDDEEFFQFSLGQAF